MGGLPAAPPHPERESLDKFVPGQGSDLDSREEHCLRRCLRIFCFAMVAGARDLGKTLPRDHLRRRGQFPPSSERSAPVLERPSLLTPDGARAVYRLVGSSVCRPRGCAVGRAGSRQVGRSIGGAWGGGSARRFFRTVGPSVDVLAGRFGSRPPSEARRCGDPLLAAPEVDLSEAAVVRRRRTSIFAGDAQSDTSMKKPRDLRVLGVAPTMCELSWDQRLLAGKAPPLNFEVEEPLCR